MDSIFKLTAAYKADPFPQKINLGVGAYRDDDSKPWVLPVVRKVRSLFSTLHSFLRLRTTPRPIHYPTPRTHAKEPFPTFPISDPTLMTPLRTHDPSESLPHPVLPLFTPYNLPHNIQASEILLHDPDLDHEYLPITGLPDFTSAAAKLILGGDSLALQEGRVVSVQTISGTGANHLGALFLSRHYGFNGEKRVYLSDPTWGAWAVCVAFCGAWLAY